MSNPILSEKAFLPAATGDRAMTIEGAVQKSLTLVGITFLAAMLTYDSDPSPTFLICTGIGGFLLSLVAFFNPRTAPITAPLYAVVEGLFVGAISSVYSEFYDGIVLQAVLLTFGTLSGMLGLYSTGIIRLTPGLSRFISIATLGIFLTYLLSLVLGFFFIQIPFIHESGLIGIGFSVVVVVIATLNFVQDFDLIESGARSGAPKYMEWYSALGLLVTLVWLYLEILRLLAKLSRRN